MIENFALTVAILLQVASAWIFIRWLNSTEVRNDVLAVAAIFVLISIGLIEGVVMR